jgi:adenylate cyclase
MTEAVFTDVPFKRRREARVRRLLVIVAVAIIVLCSLWLGIGIKERLLPIVAVEAGGLVLAFGLLAALRLGAFEVARHAGFILILALIVGIMVLGHDPAELPILHLYLICLAVGAFLIFPDTPLRVPVAYASVAAVLLVVWELGGVKLDHVLPPDPFVTEMAHHAAVIAVMFILLALTTMFVRDITEAERQLVAANERIEALLENMLPESVARRLREEGHAFADAFASCTILFADLVGFTRYASEHAAADVVDLLDRVFSRFDDLVEQVGVEKIKTIGDAYMVVAGVPVPRADHAVVIAELALRMRDVIHELGLTLRIGINTGPVVAGVIGKKRFIYDLWGDAVNVASRMETQAMPDAIQITEATAQAIAGRFEVEPLGAIDVRGRGKLAVWALKGRAAPVTGGA